MPSTETKYLWKCGECIFSKRYHFIRRILAVHLSADLSSIDSFLQIAESEPAPEANVREPIGEEPNRSFCDCRSACKTKQKNGVGRGCPCRTANLPCVQNRCKCGTGRKQCANRVSSFYYVYAYTLDKAKTFSFLFCISLEYSNSLPTKSTVQFHGKTKTRH